jgi:hypothetical protein
MFAVLRKRREVKFALAESLTTPIDHVASYVVAQAHNIIA